MKGLGKYPNNFNLTFLLLPSLFVILEGSREIKVMQVALKKQSEAGEITFPVPNYNLEVMVGLCSLLTRSFQDDKKGWADDRN